LSNGEIDLIPEGLSIVPDGIDVGGPHRQTHHTIYPNREMPFDEFSQKLSALPWESMPLA